MGEIADSLIDGEFDFRTGEYIGPGVGYPRTKEKGFKGGNPGRNYQSNKSKVWGLIFPPGNPNNISDYQIFSIVEQYVHGVLNLPKETKEKTAYKHILKNKAAFVEWYKEKYPHWATFLIK